MRIFDNINNLKKIVIDQRLQVLDPDAESKPYSYTNIETGKSHYYVGVDSDVLTDKQIDNVLSPKANVTEAAMKNLTYEVLALKSKSTGKG